MNGYEVVIVREDVALKEYAESLGYEALVDYQGMHSSGVPNNPHSFGYEEVRVWKVGEGWRIAALIRDRFMHHRTKPTLEEALPEGLRLKEDLKFIQSVVEKFTNRV